MPNIKQVCNTREMCVRIKKRGGGGRDHSNTTYTHVGRIVTEPTPRYDGLSKGMNISALFVIAGCCCCCVEVLFVRTMSSFFAAMCVVIP